MFGHASVVSWSKDSIYVNWKFNSDHTPTNQTALRGYKIRYQAVGSSVVQYTGLLDRAASDYEITHLHENTNYEICVLRLETASRSTRRPISGAAAAAMHSTGRHEGVTSVDVPRVLSAAAVACVTGTTSTDSLSVALGSTFGAFLALGFIVALVFLAKWQHSRRLAKQFAGLPLDDVHFHTSAATLQPDHSFGIYATSPLLNICSMITVVGIPILCVISEHKPASVWKNRAISV